MNFAVGADEGAFGESVRAALADYRRPDWSPGVAREDGDEALEARLRALGIAEAADAGHPFVAAAGLELGRALAPLSIIDELAVEDAALAADGLARYTERRVAALDLREDGAFLVPLNGARMHPALDTQGYVRLGDETGEETAFPPLGAWAAFHTAYFAGLATAVLALAVEHARTRVQFGKPLLALAPVQQMLADAATLARGLELLAWEEPDDPWPALVHAGEGASTVCEVAHQVHGAIGFALEGPVHSFFRRAHATRLFTRSVARAARSVSAAA